MGMGSGIFGFKYKQFVNRAWVKNKIREDNAYHISLHPPIPLNGDCNNLCWTPWPFEWSSQVGAPLLSYLRHGLLDDHRESGHVAVVALFRCGTVMKVGNRSVHQLTVCVTFHFLCVRGCVVVVFAASAFAGSRLAVCNGVCVCVITD